MLSTFITYIMSHLRNERGQDLIEYALLGGLIALAIMGAVLLLGGSIAEMASGIGNCIDFDDTSACSPF